MFKKLICIILSLSIVLSLSVNAFAVSDNDTITEHINISETNTLEITYVSPSKISRTSSSQDDIAEFEVKQYYENELIQVVTGQIGGSYLYVTDYNDGLVTSQSTRRVSDIISKNTSFTDSQDNLLSTASLGTLLGTINYNPTATDGAREKVKVYSYYKTRDTEAYTIRAHPADTIALLASALVSAITFIATLNLSAADIIKNIVITYGGSIMSSTIEVAFEEDVAAYAYYYDLTGYDVGTGRYSNTYDGIAYYILTQKSSAYNTWRYDGYTPRNWQQSAFALGMWSEFFNTKEYPGVSSYA